MFWYGSGYEIFLEQNFLFSICELLLASDSNCDSLAQANCICNLLEPVSVAVILIIFAVCL
jgi:hypothetical protein